MNKLKYLVLTLIMVSTLVGGIGQMITLNGTAVVYNAYFQLALGFVLLIWLSHKAIQATEVRMAKQPTNNKHKN